MSAAPTDAIQYARLPDNILVIRVNGRATHLEAPHLRYLFEETRGDETHPKYVVDLDDCTMMDSTFMGTLASMGMHQRRTTGTDAVVINLKPHVQQLMTTLGLSYVLEMRNTNVDAPVPVKDNDFQSVASPEISRLDRIVMMLEAHETLVDADSNNIVKFEGVLKHLRESYEQEKDKDKI